ncbi:MAG TPA: TlpA disulfide reductase family protein [Burkholderiales bacterium]|nr:TlpA disulfide reductase family protein [Burkholderiales bacterium]
MDGIQRNGRPRHLRMVLALAGVVILGAALSGIIRSIGDIGAPARTGSQIDAGWANAPQPVPHLRFLDVDGKERTLSDFHGKVILLNLWATWCAPCRKEMPALDRLQQKLGGADFQVLALSLDNGGATVVRQFYDQIGIRALGIYVDPGMEATGKLRALGVPTTLLLDREGRERWRKTGPEEWDSPEITEALRAKLRGGVP